MNIGITQDYVAEYHSAAATGDSSKLNAMLRGAGMIGNIDVPNDKGWTALMFAARNGHWEIVKTLLEKGCDRNSISASGQNALDIAKFWNHRQVIEQLEPRKDTPVSHRFHHVSETINFFSSNLLDRAAHLRKDEQWLQGALTDSKTKFVVFSNLQPLVLAKSDIDDPFVPNQRRLCTLNFGDVARHIQDNATYVFLGLEKSDDQDLPWFAIDLSSLNEEQLKSMSNGADVVAPIPSAMQLSPEEAGVFAMARSILAWHERYGFCPTCGSPTKMAEGGHKRVCSNSNCKSLQGVHNTSYPRVDPSVIMAISSPDGQRLLLGRGKNFPRGMFSCLAGFIETGESIEEACRREAFEESGVKIGLVEYHSCQPWPMPCSLMVGCLAQAKSDLIKVDNEELDQARWFSRQEVLQMISRNHPQEVYVPPPQAVAHTLIKAWLSKTPASL